jgi:16S rRNA (guanine(527)-N(7))-methyltransferase RsmG
MPRCVHERLMTNVTTLTLNPEHRAKLNGLASLLTTWNKAHNLVSRKLESNQLLNLLWEATAFERFLPQNAYIADLGSGAGIPALPLALVRPDLQIEAIEPRQKRCTWLRFAQAELGCSLRINQKRWEPSWSHFDRVISRAVFPPNDFCQEVGELAPLSLQMTGDVSISDGRTTYRVLRGREPAGLILAGEQAKLLNPEFSS